MSFKFIAGDNTILTTADAPTTSGLFMNGVFPLHSKVDSFQIGNTGSSQKDYQAIASGLNAEINNDVDFSTDRVSWTSSTTVSGIKANEVSPTIFVRYTPAANSIVASGTFLIHVDEVDPGIGF